MIPALLPPGRDDWPPGVLGALKRFRQGDVVSNVPLFYWGDPDRAVLGLTAAYAGEGEGVIEAEQRFAYGMIATQTCDIAEEDSPVPGQPWVHLCPVYNSEAHYRPDGAPSGTPEEELPKLLPGDERKLVRQGRSQRYLWLPALPGGLWIADLRLLIPVEKGWLAGRQRQDGFRSEADRIAAGRRLAWLHDRPAFDGRFVAGVQVPLVKALRALRTADCELFDRLHDQVAEIAVSTDQNLTIDVAEVVVLCNNELEGAGLQWLQDWWAQSAEAARSDGLVVLPLRVELLDELKASEYRRLTRVPLAAVSPNPAWYGADPNAIDH